MFRICRRTVSRSILVLIPVIGAGGLCADSSEVTPLAPEANQFLRGMALMLMPTTYTDDDDWGQQKRIQSGLNVGFDGLRLDTSRRWKEVNHGSWKRVDATLVEPQEHFRLKVSLLPRIEHDVPRYRIHASARLRATGRQQRWNFGVKLYSISADVLADLDFLADVSFRSEVIRNDDGSRLRVLPHIEQASLALTGFSLRNVSHMKGGAVREFGHGIESLIRRAVRKKGDKLADKINGKVQKKPEKFEVPAGILAVFGTQSPPRATMTDRLKPE